MGLESGSRCPERRSQDLETSNRRSESGSHFFIEHGAATRHEKLLRKTLKTYSGFPHKRHCDLRLAFSPLHLEQRLYIFPVNHCVMSALPPRIKIRNNRLASRSDKGTPRWIAGHPGTFWAAWVSKPDRTKEL